MDHSSTPHSHPRRQRRGVTSLTAWSLVPATSALTAFTAMPAHAATTDHAADATRDRAAVVEVFRSLAETPQAARLVTTEPTTAPSTAPGTSGWARSGSQPLNPRVLARAEERAGLILSGPEAALLQRLVQQPQAVQSLSTDLWNSLVHLGTILGLPTADAERLVAYLDALLTELLHYLPDAPDSPEPADPIPTDPTDPVEPADPATPAAPTEPTNPAEPDESSPDATPTPAPQPERPAEPTPDPAAVTPWFDSDVPATADRVVAVEGAGGSSAMLRRYERTTGGWRPVGEGVPATVGPLGIGADYGEGTPLTPAGVFTLNSAFGRAADPGASVPYTQVGPNDWWVGDSSSPLYNSFQSCAPGTCPFDESSSEHLADYDVYDYALVMGVNPEQKPHGGSAFFLHESNGMATLGCVSVPTEVVKELVRWASANTYIALR